MTGRDNGASPTRDKTFPMEFYPVDSTFHVCFFELFTHCEHTSWSLEIEKCIIHHFTKCLIFIMSMNVY